VGTPATFRWKFILLLLVGIFALVSPMCVRAQEENDIPLGDVARSFRKKPAAPEVIIDNDNFSTALKDAEDRRAAGSTTVFALDPGEKKFHLSNPDVSCSFSFNAKSGPVTDPIVLDELPRSELAKLDGPASIDGDSLQVSMHNGTTWELREVLIGLTIVQQASRQDASAAYGPARIVPAAAAGPAQTTADSFQKQPDVTMLLKAKGSAAPSTTALFRTQLNFALFPDQEWHWAIVKAKGIAPPAPVEMTTQVPPTPAQLPITPGEITTQVPPSVSLDVPVH
jgi:hypothetical protein